MRVTWTWIVGSALGAILVCAGCVGEGEAGTCADSNAETPLVLDFEPGDDVEFTKRIGATEFDLSSEQDGSGTRTDWPTSATPWLARDLDGDGSINSGRELFGSATEIDGSTTASNGFEALAPLDTDGDGRVDDSDPPWDQLLVWSDENADRVSQPSELKTASEAGLEYLGLDYTTPPPRCDDRGNCEKERARFGWRDESGQLRRGGLVDVHLKVQEPVACQLDL